MIYLVQKQETNCIQSSIQTIWLSHCVRITHPRSYYFVMLKNYQKAIRGFLQETFQMFGMDVRMAIKKSENPFHDKNAYD